jgi:hypothetical protein
MRVCGAGKYSEATVVFAQSQELYKQANKATHEVRRQVPVNYGVAAAPMVNLALRNCAKGGFRNWSYSRRAGLPY